MIDPSPEVLQTLRDCIEQDPTVKYFQLAAIQRGCAGFLFTLVPVKSASSESDMVVIGDVPFLVDCDFMEQVGPLTISYTTDKLISNVTSSLPAKNGRRLVFSGPRISNACGCGQSYAVR